MNIEIRPLDGRYVRLEPITGDHRDGLKAALNCDPAAWEIMSINGCGDGFEEWWAIAGPLFPQKQDRRDATKHDERQTHRSERGQTHSKFPATDSHFTRAGFNAAASRSSRCSTWL